MILSVNMLVCLSMFTIRLVLLNVCFHVKYLLLVLYCEIFGLM